jgi:hypothetical protein
MRYPALATVVAVALLAAVSAPNSARGSVRPECCRSHPPLVLTLSRSKGEGDKGRPLSEVEIRLEVRNAGNAPIRLDLQRLNPMLMSRLYDEHGVEVPRLPVAPPRASTLKDLVILEPEQTIVYHFSLEQMVDVDLTEERYKLVSRYDNTSAPTTEGPRFDTLKACAALEISAVGMRAALEPASNPRVQRTARGAWTNVEEALRGR